jgi:four helix bundle protein
MGKANFEQLKVYHLAEKLADEIWKMVQSWQLFEKNMIGSQIVRSADSTGANIAEGTGRKSFQDNRRFVRNARGSLYETMHWLRRCVERKLITKEQTMLLQPIVDELAPKLNAYLKSIGNVPTKISQELS